VAKCGDIVVWHWSHRADECDPWYEPESDWHLQKKLAFPPEWQEVVVGNHRADVKTPTIVIELQASSLAPEEITERESFYGRMVWVLRGSDFWDSLNFRQRDGFVSFRWKWPRKSWWFATKPVYICPNGSTWDGRAQENDWDQSMIRDLGRSMFLIKKLHHETPCGGWGQWVTELDFFRSVGFTTSPLEPTL
jgi:hypothetical protein